MSNAAFDIATDSRLADHPLTPRKAQKMPVQSLYSNQFLTTLQAQIGAHHSLYPVIPPQGIYFEGLVEKSFKINRVPFTEVATGGTTAPQHDLLVGKDKISLKTETGKGTKRDLINITKLCTTEKDPWEPAALVNHVMNHLSRYEHMLMLRSVWDDRVIHYQIIDIPVVLLRRLATGDFQPVGKRKGRRSLGADVSDESGVAFHIHFDGSDGKCQLRNLHRDRCNTLLEWDYQFAD